MGSQKMYTLYSDNSGKLKGNVDFHCRRCLEGENDLFQSVLLKNIVIEPNVKLECVPKFCYLGEWQCGGGSKSLSEMRLGIVQGVISYPDRSGCIILHKRKDMHYTRLVSRVYSTVEQRKEDAKTR